MQCVALVLYDACTFRHVDCAHITGSRHIHSAGVPKKRPQMVEIPYSVFEGIANLFFLQVCFGSGPHHVMTCVGSCYIYAIYTGMSCGHLLVVSGLNLRDQMLVQALEGRSCTILKSGSCGLWV